MVSSSWRVCTTRSAQNRSTREHVGLTYRVFDTGGTGGTHATASLEEWSVAAPVVGSVAGAAGENKGFPVAGWKAHPVISVCTHKKVSSRGMEITL